MGVLINYIHALLWGILLGLISSALIIYFINKIFAVSRLLTGLVGLAMLLFLAFQYTALIGASQTKKYVDKAAILTQVAGENFDWEVVKKEYPLFQPYLGKIEKVSENTTNAGKTIAYTINKAIDRYIWRRIGWIIGGIVIAFGVPVLAGMTGTNRLSRSRKHTSGTHRHNHSRHQVRRQY